MKSQQKLFVESFDTEATLRGAVHDLLLRMPNVKWAQLTHGSQEHGKDIVFSTVGGLGENVVCACVIKNQRISGAVDDARGAMTVLHQVSQALKHPFIDGEGREAKVSRVYVMTPFEISQTALKSIEGEMRDRSGQIVFTCGRQLLDLFENHYPEYLLLKSGLLTSYVSSLRQAFEDVGPLHHLAIKHGMLAFAKQRTSRAYVRPTFYARVRAVSARPCDIPKAEDLSRGISANDLDGLLEYLDRLADLLQQYAEWTPGGGLHVSTIRKLLDQIKACGVAVKRGWEIALRRDLHRTGRTERNARYLVRLAPEGSRAITEELGSLRSKVDKLVGQMGASAAKAASACARQTDGVTQPLGILSSADYLECCKYGQLSKHSPELLSAGAPALTAQYSETFLDEHGDAILITGPPGYGKTSFCKWSALHDGELFAKGESNLIPIYVPLHRFAQSIPGSFEAAFLGQDNLPQILEVQHKIGDATRIRLYLDGLDEVPIPRQKQIVELARERAPGLRRVQIVITGRDHVTGPWLHWLPRVQISELDEEKVRDLAAQLLEGNQVSILEFFRQLKQVPSLGQLMRVPLLATLIVSVYATMTTLPEGRIELYRIFVDLTRRSRNQTG